MTQKSIYRFFIYALYTVLLLYIMSKAMQMVQIFDRNGFFFGKTALRLTIATIFPMIIGILFSLPSFLSNFNKPGFWHMDGIKLFSVGIPTLYVAILPLLYFSPIGKYFPAVGLITTPNSAPAIICGTIFGYLILSVFSKKSIY